MSESNPGPLDEKRKHYQRAIPLTSLKDTSCATEPLLLSPTSWQGGIDTLINFLMLTLSLFYGEIRDRPGTSIRYTCAGSDLTGP